MKILHTADWHLGKRLQGFNRIAEQRQVLQEIVKIADREKVNAVLVAGDLFDTYNPVTEAIELFYSTLHQLSDYGNRAVIAIAGNHDSAERIEAPHPLAASCGIVLFGQPDTVISPFKLSTGLSITRSEPGFIEICLPKIDYPLRLILTPYANEVTFKKFLGKDHPQEELRRLLDKKWKQLAGKYFDHQGVNVLTAHLYLMSRQTEAPEEDEGEKSILFQGGAQAIFTENLPRELQYTALGHLHRPQDIAASHPVVYSGSPLCYSFSEAEQKKQVEIVTIEPGKPAHRKQIALRSGKKLTRQRFEDIDGAVNWLEDHPDTYVELTIVSDDYLGAKDKLRLYQAHEGIISIIPEIKSEHDRVEKSKNIDLSKDLKSLFTEYFKFRKGQDPAAGLLEVFDEIINS